MARAASEPVSPALEVAVLAALVGRDPLADAGPLADARDGLGWPLPAYREALSQLAEARSCHGAKGARLLLRALLAGRAVDTSWAPRVRDAAARAARWLGVDVQGWERVVDPWPASEETEPVESRDGRIPRSKQQLFVLHALQAARGHFVKRTDLARDLRKKFPKVTPMQVDNLVWRLRNTHGWVEIETASPESPDAGWRLPRNCILRREAAS